MITIQEKQLLGEEKPLPCSYSWYATVCIIEASTYEIIIIYGD